MVGPGKDFVAIWIPVGWNRGMSPDPLTFVTSFGHLPVLAPAYTALPGMVEAQPAKYTHTHTHTHTHAPLSRLIRGFRNKYH